MRKSRGTRSRCWDEITKWKCIRRCLTRWMTFLQSILKLYLVVLVDSVHWPGHMGYLSYLLSIFIFILELKAEYVCLLSCVYYENGRHDHSTRDCQRCVSKPTTGLLTRRAIGVGIDQTFLFYFTSCKDAVLQWRRINDASFFKPC